MSDDSQWLRGAVFALLGALCFSVSGTLQALAPAGATPFVVAESRAIVGALGLALCCLVRPPRLAQIPDGFWTSVLRCAVWIGAAQTLFFWGAYEVGVAASTTIGLAMSPIFAAFFEWVLNKRRPGKVWFVSTFLALFGVFLIGKGLGEGTPSLALLLPISMGFCYAAYMVCNQSIPVSVAPQVSVLAILVCVAILFSPVFFFFPSAWIFESTRGLVITLLIGFVTASMAFSFVLTGIRIVGVASASTLGLAEPVSAALLGIFVLKEASDASTLMGIGCVFVAIVALVVSQTRRPRGIARNALREGIK